MVPPGRPAGFEHRLPGAPVTAGRPRYADAMSTPDDAPEADTAEQRELADGLPDQSAGDAVHPSDQASEADLAEQAVPVETVQVVVPGSAHDEVDEADWLDQNVVELDDDERR